MLFASFPRSVPLPCGPLQSLRAALLSKMDAIHRAHDLLYPGIPCPGFLDQGS